MEGIREAIAFITDLAVKAEKPETIEINGRTYCTKSLKRYDEADKAEPIRATTLTSLVDYIKESREELRDRMIIQVVNATKVLLYSGLLPERDRETLFEVNALLPHFEYGREYDQESFLRPSQYKYKEDNTVQYRPKIIKGTVKGTGWPIDGHTLYFSQWDYDNRESWHLYGWDEPDDESVMQTTYQTETAAGLCLYDTLEGFTEAWKAKKWEPQGAFCLTLEQVDVVEVLQEEVRNETREELRARGFDLTPRKYSDKGGILCLPLDKNLNGDTKKKHPDWELIDCPLCGQKCWKMPAADKLKEAQDVTYLCTECAIKAGFLSDYPRNRRKPGGNREQRRRAKRNARR